MPPRYYTLASPPDDRRGGGRRSSRCARPTSTTSPTTRENTDELLRVFRTMINNLFPVARAVSHDADARRTATTSSDADSPRKRLRPGPARADFARTSGKGRIGLSQEPVAGRYVEITRRRRLRPDLRATCPFAGRRDPARGESKRLRNGEAAVVSLAAGVGSRWTSGAGVVKAVNPFVMIDGKHRSFLELHLAKTAAGPASEVGGGESRTSSRPAS